MGDGMTNFGTRALASATALVIGSVLAVGTATAGTANVPVEIGRRMILPASEPRPDGTTLTLQPGDVVGAARPGWAEVAVVEAGGERALDRGTLRLKPGAILVRSRPVGAGADLIGGETTIYCGQQNYAVMRSSGLLTGLVALREVAASQVFAEPNTCLADTDADGQFDTVLRLAGAKPPVITSIAPLAYTRRERFPIPGRSAITLRYRGLNANGAARFAIDYVDEGHNEEFREIRFVSSDGTGHAFAPTFELPANGMGQSVAGLELAVLSVAPATRAAMVRLDHDFRETPFGLTVTRTLLLVVPR
jgi:hypothetical protein